MCWIETRLKSITNNKTALALNYFEYSRNVTKLMLCQHHTTIFYDKKVSFQICKNSVHWLFGYCNANIKGKCWVKRDAAYEKFLGERVEAFQFHSWHILVSLLESSTNPMKWTEKNWTFESKIKLLCCTRCCWKILDVKTYLKKNPRIITRLFQLSSFCSSFSWACLFPDWSSWPEHRFAAVLSVNVQTPSLGS